MRWKNSTPVSFERAAPHPAKTPPLRAYGSEMAHWYWRQSQKLCETPQPRPKNKSEFLLITDGYRSFQMQTHYNRLSSLITKLGTDSITDGNEK